MTKRWLVAPAMALVTTGVLAQAPTSPIAKAAAKVSAARIREQDKFISDDLFEGRYPGLRGGELAAKYIASQFAMYGLKPAGDNGSFLQQVNFVGMKAIPEQTAMKLIGADGKNEKLTFGSDYTVSNQTLTPETMLDAPIVFVGYGADAPEFQWNDYAGVDVKGKVILCIVGDPPSKDPKFFGGDALTYYGRWTYKFEEAARKGAVGALIIHRTDLASYGWNVVQNSNTSEKTYLRDDANPRLQAASWIQLDVAKKLFAMSGLDLDKEFEAAGQRGFKAVELPVKLKATVTSTVRPFQSPNVVAMLPGANADGHDQAVLFSGHYDHLGIVPGMKGDNIYNGAADNGTGVAMLLEMARVWSDAVHSGELKLPHSVIFGAVTAEEQGLLGSEYLGQHPPIPASQIALDINYDMLLPIGVQQEINVNGAQRTTFFPEVEATAKRFGLAIVPDPRPSAGSYYRSDHFSLSRVGIPSFSVDSGSLYEGHDRAWGVAQEKAFNDNDYHNFSDNFHDDWDFTGDAKLVKFGMDLGWQVIHLPKTVEWKHGDEFEAARLKSER
ncbi:M28 family peptidase [Granulicella paludicola]|uniref:M28 family peptidase n=1 Tax=Granulicella paludicola TaxID=474951 RepID=UPI0021E06460|nr:M28 family peptidase [Granulicella paludicola]